MVQPAQGVLDKSVASWDEVLTGALSRWCDVVAEASSRTVLRTRRPILALCGLTPGPLYHSHPHVAAEFDGIPLDMRGQVEAILSTAASIAKSAGVGPAWTSDAHLIHFVARERAQACQEASEVSLSRDGAASLPADYLSITRLITDPRMLVEMMPLVGLPPASSSGLTGCIPPVLRRVDVAELYDPGCFMPYCPALHVPEGVELVVFSANAAGANADGSTPASAAGQTEAMVERIVQRLIAEGCGAAPPGKTAAPLCPYGETREARAAARAAWDGVVIVLSKGVDVARNEEPFLMTRSRKGLDRPVAEAFLEVASLGESQDGVPLLIENVVVAARGVAVAH